MYTHKQKSDCLFLRLSQIRLMTVSSSLCVFMDWSKYSFSVCVYVCIQNVCLRVYTKRVFIYLPVYTG